MPPGRVLPLRRSGRELLQGLWIGWAARRAVQTARARRSTDPKRWRVAERTFAVSEGGSKRVARATISIGSISGSFAVAAIKSHASALDFGWFPVRAMDDATGDVVSRISSA